MIDFGLGCITMEENKRYYLSLNAGSVFYITHDVLNGNYNELCDVWSNEKKKIISLFTIR